MKIALAIFECDRFGATSGEIGVAVACGIGDRVSLGKAGIAAALRKFKFDKIFAGIQEKIIGAFGIRGVGFDKDGIGSGDLVNVRDDTLHTRLVRVLHAVGVEIVPDEIP